MFPRISSVLFFAFFAFALLAAATPAPALDNAKRWAIPTPTTSATVTTTITVTAPASTATPADQCSTGSVQCCQGVQSASEASSGLILGLLGIVLSTLDVLLGFQCSPIQIVGIGSGNECSANVVCCENNSVGGLISIGCIPIIL